MDIGALGKGKGKQGKDTHGKGKNKGKQGQQGQQGRDRSKDKDKNKDSIECWNCEKRGHSSRLLEQEEHQQRWLGGVGDCERCHGLWTVIRSLLQSSHVGMWFQGQMTIYPTQCQTALHEVGRLVCPEQVS